MVFIAAQSAARCGALRAFFHRRGGIQTLRRDSAHGDGGHDCFTHVAAKRVGWS